MIECAGCGRHIREAETACPFCARRSTLTRAFNLVAGGVTTFVLAACYGAPPGDTSDSAIDADGDTYTTDDCNDADAAINPGATEICDDAIDNDCDEAIDAADTDCAGS